MGDSELVPLRETSANAPLQLSMRSSPNQLYRVHSKSIFLTGLAGIGALLFGLHLGWASPARKSLQHQSGLSDKQIDIILGVLNIGAAIGSLLAAPIAEILGRKTTIIFAKLPFILGTMIMSFLTQSMFWLVLGRILIGVGIGFECVLVTLYVTEISPSKLRGALGCVNQIMITVGILLASVGGLWWTWKDSLLWFTLPCVFQIIGMIIYAPETPRWLILQRKEESALHVLHNLRDDDQGWNVDEEFSLLSQQIKKDRVVDGFNISSLFHVLKSDSTITRALLIGFSLQIFQQGSGINAVMFNTASLFNSKISLSNQAGLLYAILVNIFQVLLTIVSSFFVDRQGRKFLLLISYTGMAVCSLLTFVFQIHVLFMVLYIGFFSIGAGPVTWIYCGEIYPPKLRSVSMSLATVVNWTMSFFVTASFGSLKEILGSDNSVFFLYGAVSCIGAYTIHFQFPETKDKTDGEIYQCLSK